MLEILSEILKSIYPVFFTADVFLVLTGHPGSEELSPKEAYSSSLTRLFKPQPKVAQLAKQGAFVSLGFAFEPHKLQFNLKQSELIVNWVKQNIPL